MLYITSISDTSSLRQPCAWWDRKIHGKEEWRFNTMVTGVPYAIGTSTHGKRKLFVECWDTKTLECSCIRSHFRNRKLVSTLSYMNYMYIHRYILLCLHVHEHEESIGVWKNKRWIYYGHNLHIFSSLNFQRHKQRRDFSFDLLSIFRVENVTKYGLGAGIIWLPEIQCTGQEDDIDDCRSFGYGYDLKCRHTQDAAVSCGIFFDIILLFHIATWSCFHFPLFSVYIY